MTPELAAGWSALVAAAATVVGMIALGERHPLSAVGGLLAFVGSTAFLVDLGVRLVSGDLTVPTWNA